LPASGSGRVELLAGESGVKPPASARAGGETERREGGEVEPGAVGDPGERGGGVVSEGKCGVGWDREGVIEWLGCSRIDKGPRCTSW
jgi:hypothetical protein